MNRDAGGARRGEGRPRPILTLDAKLGVKWTMEVRAKLQPCRKKGFGEYIWDLECRTDITRVILKGKTGKPDLVQL